MCHCVPFKYTIQHYTIEEKVITNIHVHVIMCMAIFFFSNVDTTKLEASMKYYKHAKFDGLFGKKLSEIPFISNGCQAQKWVTWSSKVLYVCMDRV